MLGIAGLAFSQGNVAGRPISWEALLAPYSLGAPLADGFRIDAIRRGTGSEVVISATRRDDAATIEVHVVQRGRWSGVRESYSFGIGYEIPHTSAARAASEAVTQQLAETIRSRDGGLPSPDAIPLRPAPDSSVLVWWLEMLRGVRGVLIGTSLVVLALLMLVRSPGMAIAGLVVGATDLIACIVGVPVGDLDLGGGWLIPAATALIVMALRGRRVGSSRDRRRALAVAGIALALRLILGAWGPLHINGQGPLWIASATGDPQGLEAYGRGYRELFAPMVALAPANPDWAIFIGNAFISALVPGFAFVLGRLAGMPPLAAGLGALLLAIDPVAIRTAATESYFPSIILLSTAAGAALLFAARTMAVGDSWRAAACVGSAGLLLVQAARIHPAAWGPAAAVPFLALAGEAGSLGRRVLLFLATVMLLGGLLACTSGGSLLDVLSNVRGGTLMRPPPPSLRPLAYVLSVTLLYAVIAPNRGLAIAAGVCAAGLALTGHVYGQSWIWQQSYDRLYLTVPVMAAIGFVGGWLRHRWALVSLSLLVALAWVRFGLPITAARTTDHLEYRWVRKELARLPRECRVIYAASADRRALVLPSYVGPRPAVAMNVREPHTIDAALAPTACLYYVHTSLCSSVEGRPVCDAIERRLTVAPVARIELPARPSFDAMVYDSDPVEVSVARVEHVVGDE